MPPPGESARARSDVIPSTSRRALVDAGFEVIEEQQPSFLFDRSYCLPAKCPAPPDTSQASLHRRAQHAMSARFGEAFIPNSVGTRFEL